jgi:CheY-like chemotaxis protein
LLGNAVKFTTEGGIAVRIRAQEQEGDRLRIAIEVEDTGCGIAADDLERVFAAFEQVRGIWSIAGTGLGLPISRQSARMMGGDLTVNSTLGKGSVFRFEFQAIGGLETDIHKLRIRERVLVLAPGQKEFRILVVDDRRENRLLLVRLLSEVGFLTREARNGAESVAAFQEWRPHMILMDMLMPGMDGREAVRRIRAMPGGQQTAVLMVSASAMEEDRASALASGADGFLHKPFLEEEIFDALQRLTGVQYIFEEREASAPTVKPGTSVDVLSRDEIGSLPKDMVAAMYDAVSAARMDDLLKLIESVSEHHPKVGDGLRALAEQFQYDALLELLDPGQS